MTRAYLEYGALATRIRALYGKRLGRGDLARLAALESLEALMDALFQSPGWREAMARLRASYGGYTGRAELEAALWGQVWAEYRSLLPFIPLRDRPILDAPLLLAQQRAILDALRRLRGGGPPRPVLHPGHLEAALAACASYEDLVQATRNTIYAPALIRLAGSGEAPPPYSQTETVLRTAYYAHLLRIARRQYRGQTGRVLLEMLGTQVDLLNLLHLLRLKAYFPQVEDCRAFLLPFYHRLSPTLTDALCAQADASGVFALLRTSPYAQAFSSGQVARAEEECRLALFRLYRRRLVQGPPSVCTALAYLSLKELELRGLVTVVEAVKYGAPFPA